MASGYSEDCFNYIEPKKEDTGVGVGGNDAIAQNGTLTGIIVSPLTLSLGIGQTHQFTAQVLPDNLASDFPVTWSTTNTAVGTIDAHGVFTAISAGSTEVVATISVGFNVHASVKVEILLTSLSVAAVPDMTVGDTYQLIVTRTPANATEDLVYASTDNAVATITAGGLISAASAGTVTLSLTGAVSGMSSSTQLKVNVLHGADDFLRIKNNLSELSDAEEHGRQACLNIKALSFGGNELFPDGEHNTQSAATLNAIGHMRKDIVMDLNTVHGLKGMSGEGALLTIHRKNLPHDYGQLYFDAYGDSSFGSLWFRAFNDWEDTGTHLNTQNWYQLIGMNDITVDSGGFLKKASPVVKIFSDGACELNDQAMGVTVVRESVGIYRIEGCTGLNADAVWGGIDGGFDVPSDKNKQPLIWLDYEVNADGSILVKTFHRLHPEAPVFAKNEIAGIADGDPIDIPMDQFVSVRVEMPVSRVYNQLQIFEDNSMEEAEVSSEPKSEKAVTNVA